MSEQLQEKSGNIVWLVFIPEVLSWWSNLSRTGFLSNSSFELSEGRVVSDEDQVFKSDFGNKILL